MLATLPDPLSGYRRPPIFDLPQESLDYFMSKMVATDFTVQAPSPSSEGSSWISKSPTPTLHYDTSSSSYSLMFDGGLEELPNGHLHDSNFGDDLQQYISNAPVTSSRSFDLSWPTNSLDLFSHGEISVPTQATHYFQIPDGTILPEEPSTTNTGHIKPTRLLPNCSGVDTHYVDHGDPSYDWQRDPRAMRECLMLQANGKPLAETFRKSAKNVVATPNTRKASSARRKHAARFKCPIDGCYDDFTRKHNLDNHLRSHCGITDLICDVCNQGFTTIPVWKRHKKTCRHPPFLT